MLGMKVDIEPPANTPTNVARTNAEAEPKKTAKGFLDVPLNVKVANWVLSPSSAINIVIKDDIKRFIIIFLFYIKNSITNPYTY